MKKSDTKVDRGFAIPCCDKDWDLIALIESQNVKRGQEIHCPVCNRVLGTRQS